MAESRALANMAIETIARSIFNEARNYGFSTQDYVRLVNAILDLTAANNVVAKSSDQEATTCDPMFKCDHLPIVGKRVCLRQISRSDLPLAATWTQDKIGRHFLLSTTTSECLAVDDILDDSDNELSVLTLKDGTPIGLMAYLGIDRKQGKAELRKLIGEEEHRGRGYAKEATRYWITYGIKKLGLHKIFLHTLNTHLRNIKLNEELGFQIEGLLKEECLIDGQYQDILRMGLLTRRFLAAR